MKEVTFHLEVFDGPLDLLLHLLSKNKVEIKDIPIASILDQYLEYIRQMKEFDLEVASEFITMAAQLMFIKSKMLLPVYEDENEEDPRASLVEALLEYQRIKEAGSVLSLRAQIGVDLLYEIVLDFLVYLENNPLSDIYFINLVSCGLCLSFVNKVFHRFNF